MKFGQTFCSLRIIFSALLNTCMPVTQPASSLQTAVTDSRDGSPSPALLEIGGISQTAGVGTFCWSSQPATGESVDICVDKIGLPTVQNPLISTSPVTARLTLPLDDPPQRLELSVFRAAPGNEVKVEAGTNEFRYWIPGEGINQELALQTIQDITLDLESGLFVFYVFGAWTGKGDVSYGFLVQVK